MQKLSGTYLDKGAVGKLIVQNEEAATEKSGILTERNPSSEN